MQGQPMATERFEQEASNANKQAETIANHPAGATTDTQQYAGEGNGGATG